LSASDVEVLLQQFLLVAFSVVFYRLAFLLPCMDVSRNQTQVPMVTEFMGALLWPRTGSQLPAAVCLLNCVFSYVIKLSVFQCFDSIHCMTEWHHISS